MCIRDRPDDVISELAGNNPVKQISLAYSGDFGFKASLTYNIGSEYAGKYGNLLSLIHIYL